MKWPSVKITAGVLLTAVLVFAAENWPIIEENDFSSTLGNWKLVHFTGVKYKFDDVAKKFLGDDQVVKTTSDAAVSLADGWMTVSSPKDGDFDENLCTKQYSWGWGICNEPVRGMYMVSTGGGLFYPAPTGDYVFETRFKQGTWYDGGEHGGGNKSVIIRNSIDSIADPNALWMCLATCGSYFNCPNMKLAVHRKDTPQGGPDPSVSTGQFTPGGREVYVRISKTGKTFTFSCSNDGSTWSEIDSRTGNYGGWIGLCDTHGNGTTSYDYVKITGNGAPQSWDKVTGISQLSRGSSDIMHRLTFSGNSLTGNLPFSRGSLKVFTMSGKVILTRDITATGEFQATINRNLPAGSYVARVTGPATTIQCIFSTVK